MCVLADRQYLVVETTGNERQGQHVDGCEKSGLLLLPAGVQDQLFAQVVRHLLTLGLHLLDDLLQDCHHFAVAGSPLCLVAAHRFDLLRISQ